jgi:hypothetical protein
MEGSYNMLNLRTVKEIVMSKEFPGFKSMGNTIIPVNPFDQNTNAREHTSFGIFTESFGMMDKFGYWPDKDHFEKSEIDIIYIPQDLNINGIVSFKPLTKGIVIVHDLIPHAIYKGDNILIN